MFGSTFWYRPRSTLFVFPCFAHLTAIWRRYTGDFPLASAAFAISAIVKRMGTPAARNSSLPGRLFFFFPISSRFPCAPLYTSQNSINSLRYRRYETPQIYRVGKVGKNCDRCCKQDGTDWPKLLLSKPYDSQTMAPNISCREHPYLTATSDGSLAGLNRSDPGLVPWRRALWSHGQPFAPWRNLPLLR